MEFVPDSAADPNCAELIATLNEYLEILCTNQAWTEDETHEVTSTLVGCREVLNERKIGRAHV